MDLCPAVPSAAPIPSCDLWDWVRIGCSALTEGLALPPAQDTALLVRPSIAGASGSISEQN